MQQTRSRCLAQRTRAPAAVKAVKNCCTRQHSRPNAGPAAGTVPHINVLYMSPTPSGMQGAGRMQQPGWEGQGPVGDKRTSRLLTTQRQHP